MVNRQLVFFSTLLALFSAFLLLGCSPSDPFSAAQSANQTANEGQAQQPITVDDDSDEPYPVNTEAPPPPEPTKEATLPPYPVSTPLPTKEPTPSEPQPPTPSLTEMAITPTTIVYEAPPPRDVEPILFTELIKRDPIYLEVARLAGLDIERSPDALVMPDEYLIVVRSDLFDEGLTEDGKNLRQLGEEITAKYGGEFRTSSYWDQAIPLWFSAVMTPQQILELANDKHIDSFNVMAVISHD